jgi:hypothetical protein
MGGNFFASGPDPLHTPRMPREVYLAVKSRCLQLLRGLFDIVESPIDGPGKDTFGDIDILVHGPKFAVSTKEELLKSLETLLGASRMVTSKEDDVSVHLALPWPSETEISSIKRLNTLQDGLGTRVVQNPDLSMEDVDMEDVCMEDAAKDRYIQVDVRVCREMQKLQWVLFKHGHGDMWNMLGTTIRPYGLTIDEVAFWLRVPEIEQTNKNRAKVFLSSEPLDVLEFLGLRADDYWKGPFPSHGEAYEYAATCRMFWVKPEAGPNDSLVMGDASTVDRKALKSQDRRRMNTRPCFRQWIDEFLPECRRQGRFPEQPTTREKVTEEALARFGVRDEFEKRRRDYLQERTRDFIWRNLIKEAIPQPDITDGRALVYRGCAIKALKRVILEDSTEYGVAAGPGLKDEYGTFIIEKVVEFIEKNKDAVGSAAYMKHQGAYVEMKKKQQELQAART